MLRQHAGAGELLEHAVGAAEALHLLQLCAEVRQVELAPGGELAGQAFGLALIHLALGVLDERKHIAHAEDARRHAIRVERFQRVRFLAGGEELDGLAGDRAHREGGAAARVSVHLGEHHAGERKGFAERLGGDRRILPGHRVHDEQRLYRLHRGVQIADFRHHLLVHGEAAGGVHDEHVVELGAGVGQGAFGDGDGFFGRGARYEPGAGLGAEQPQLIDGRRTIDVRAHHRHALALPLLQVPRQFGRGGGFARALQAGQQHHRRRVGGEVQGVVGLAHQAHQLVAHHLHERLPGVQGRIHLPADGAFAHPVDEGAHHGQADIRLQKRHAHLAHRFRDVRFRETVATGDGAHGSGQPFAEVLEHGPVVSLTCERGF